MFAEDQDENVASSATDEIEESSTSEDQPEDEATSKEAADKEPPFNEHPRWKEIQEEKRQLKEENKRLQEKMFEIIDRSPSENKQTIEEKLYEANTPEERAFWQQVEKIAEKKAQAQEKALRQEWQAERQAIYNQTGKIMAEQFLRNHPEIEKGSTELQEIVQKAKDRNLDLEEARVLVMYNKDIERAVEKERQQRQQKIKQKRAANLERESVSEAGLPQKKDVTLSEAFADAAKELEISLD